MKLLIYTDNHFREHASIINTYGDKFSTRLENQLKSLDWVRQTAEDNNCDLIICAGDFFDRPELNENEITAVKDIKWSSGNKKMIHHFIVGNHESSTADLAASSTKILEGADSYSERVIFSEPTKLEYNTFELCYLPYVVERDRKPISEYFGEKTQKPRIIISHNDIAGIQMGPVVSSIGFSIEELEANADLVVNGHLHNGTVVSNKVLNLGNLTGKDFGEDAEKYQHKVMLIDTDTFSCSFFENPHAFNFYKLEILEENDIKKLYDLKPNAVLSIKCNEELLDKVKTVLNILEADCSLTYKQFIKYRLIPIKIISKTESVEEVDISDLTVDYLPKLIECVHDKLGTSEAIEAVLAAICA